MSAWIFNAIRAWFWRLAPKKPSPAWAAFLDGAKMLMLAWRGFADDLGSLRAAALTLYTLFSIVPMIAVVFGIAKGFGFDGATVRHLLGRGLNSDALAAQLIDFAGKLLESTQGELVAGIGIALLFWTVIGLIGNIEEAFNAIWKIAKGRTTARRFADYLAWMLLAPVVLITASSLIVFVKIRISWLMAELALPAFGTWLIVGALSFSPIVLMSGLFAVLFIVMPNTNISYRAGIIAGMVTGAVYSLSQWVYLSLQIGVSSYNAIYGSFAALPLFVVWLQGGWMIVLYGCELGFYIQHRRSDRNWVLPAGFSIQLNKLIALHVLRLIVKNLASLNTPLSAAQIAESLAIPVEIAEDLLSRLVAGRLIVELKSRDDGARTYLPAMDINALTIGAALTALERCGQNQWPDCRLEPAIVEAVAEFEKAMTASPCNRLLKDL
ncbi:YihY/virulence factor BrkB family protein [Methylomonas sp. MED-D]|uniref:YihY/virulence factor BrkB family protein n=1 Tax=Methylomonas sp. MED-D TaxID=3418768 RepID=UPI003D08E5EA